MSNAQIRRLVPKMKNCRVDVVTLQGRQYSHLVDYTEPWSETVIFVEAGVLSIGVLYRQFSSIVKEYLDPAYVSPRSIEAWPWYGYHRPFRRIPGLVYVPA